MEKKAIVILTLLLSVFQNQSIYSQMIKYDIFNEVALIVKKESGFTKVFFLINNKFAGPFLKYDINENRIVENGFHFKNKTSYLNTWDYDNSGNLLKISRRFYCLKSSFKEETTDVIVLEEGVFQKNTFRFIGFKPFNYPSQYFVWGIYPNVSSEALCYDEVVGNEIFCPSDMNELVDSSLVFSKSNKRNFVAVLNEGNGENYFVGFTSFIKILFYDLNNQFLKKDEVTISMNDFQCNRDFQVVPLCGFYTKRLTPIMYLANDVCSNIIW